MKKKYVKSAKLLCFCVVSILSVHQTLGDGYRNPPPTAEGIGKSGVNMIFADDASAISYNPANLAFQTNSSFVLNVTLAQSESTFASPSATAGAKEAVSDGSWQALPNLYLSIPIGDRGIVAGLGITTPFGQGIEYNKTDLYNPIYGVGNGFGPGQPIYEAEIGLINFNPTIAFKIGEGVAIGVGADIYYSTLSFKQQYPFSLLPTPPAPPGGFPDQDAEADADGYGFGGNAAITWKMTEKQKLALSYRSKVKVEYDGDLKVTPGLALTDSSFKMDIEYPAVIGAGYGIELLDSVRVEANIEWLEWSANENQNADLGANGTLSAPQNWNDTITVGIGGDWQFASGWVARAGYAFIESPIPDETMAPILPDANRQVLSFGLGYTYKVHTFDLAYAFSFYEDRNNSGNPNATYQGAYDIDSNLVGLTYSASF